MKSLLCFLFFFVSPLENFSVSVAAIDDAYNQHTGNRHISYDFIYMNGYIHGIFFSAHNTILPLQFNHIVTF